MTNPIHTNPHQEYSARLQARRAQAANAAEKYRKIGYLRICLLLTGAILIIRILFTAHQSSAWWLIPIGLASLLLIGIHQKIFRNQRRFERAVKFYETSLHRLEGDWAGKGITGERFRHSEHQYAEDLDLFGTGSLFELICTARTRAGEERLANWLLNPAALDEIRARQEAVRELQPKIDLRESLALLGEDLRTGINPEALINWGKNKSLPPLKFYRLLTASLCLLTTATLIAGLMGATFIPFYLLLAIDTFVGLWIRPKINEIIREVEPAARDLKLLSEVLARLEAEEFHSIKLISLRRMLETNRLPPSRQIARLHRYISWLDARLNQVFRPLSAPFFWVSQFALATESWRVRSGPLVENWIAAVGEIEALCSLANHGYEHPGDTFPEILSGAPNFVGEHLGHPLLPEKIAVRTDLVLNSELHLLVVSGSNMSGKSTLLRTVGTNIVLALAGSTVRARSLKLTPFQLGASIRIQDNLRAGASLFYAEITRLRKLMKMTRDEIPVLFIIDEILHGTNSHDRRIGAEAVLRGLVHRGACGLVTTHDLALTSIVDDKSVRAKNVHFEDHLENGRMTFDYVLRDGIVKKSNAIELMRSVGLEI